tara:strand:+ start:227 stop:487 length:261 start_codon:yes stop_codon:yes gene_type:complete
VQERRSRAVELRHHPRRSRSDRRLHRRDYFRQGHLLVAELVDDDVAYDDALHHVRKMELARAEEWDRTSYRLRSCGRDAGNRGTER